MKTSLATIAPPSFDQAYVISDLHIGGAENFQIFSAGSQFEALIAHILEGLESLPRKNNTSRVLLVINGDFVDFLAEPYASSFNMDRAPAMLDEIFERPQFEPVMKALRHFVKSDGTRLVITLGNHDIELALPATRRKLMHLLTNGQGELERNVEFCFDGWGYRFQVAGRQALCLHGNESDQYNFTRYDELDRVIHEIQFNGTSEFAADCRPSAGSEFVIKAINPIKKEFPFIDLLKPEIPLAATALVMLDFNKLGYAEEVVRLTTQARENERQRPESQRRMLSTFGTDEYHTARDKGAGRFTDAQDIEWRTQQAILDGTIDQLIDTPRDERFLGPTEWLDSLRNAVTSTRRTIGEIRGAVVKSLKDAKQATHKLALRAALLPLVTDDPYLTETLDRNDLAVERGIRGPYDVVFAGHTHFRRIARRPFGNGIHVNTGTWAGLMSLSRTQVIGEQFDKIYAALMTGTREALEENGLMLVRDECTVARMSPGESGQCVVTLGGVLKSANGLCAVNFDGAPTLTLTGSPNQVGGVE
ncbi:MAG: metallophosphoesterase [Planctomycetota bacterium]|nr:metallophosphoesterase [Planctomycetota bacterium]